MPQQDKGWLFLLITAIVVLITQAIAFSASPSKASEDRRYTLNILAAYVIAVQWLVFIHAGGFFGNERTEKYYDLTGSLTFLTTLALSLYLAPAKLQLRNIILSVMVAVWASRLGWFLFSRIHNNNGIDSRFTMLKQSLPRFLVT